MTDERRLEPRAESFKFGTVLSDGAAAEAVCMIWNDSSRGAKIEVEHPEKLPQRFVLDVGNSGSLRSCSVIWRVGRKVGVVFEPALSSDATG